MHFIQTKVVTTDESKKTALVIAPDPLVSPLPLSGSCGNTTSRNSLQVLTEYKKKLGRLLLLQDYRSK